MEPICIHAAADSVLHMTPVSALFEGNALRLQGGDSALQELPAAALLAADVLPRHQAARHGAAKES